VILEDDHDADYRYGRRPVGALQGLDPAALHTWARSARHWAPASGWAGPSPPALWGDPDGPAHFTFDKPSDQFASFANPDITAVGEEFDHKMAALLEHLGVAVPDALLTT
jgi:hypothetical protein